MDKEVAYDIIESLVFGCSLRRISELYETDPELIGNQMSGTILVEQAIELLGLDLDSVYQVQDTILTDRSDLYDKHKALFKNLMVSNKE